MEEKEEAKIESLRFLPFEGKERPTSLLSMILAVYSYLAFCAQRNAIFFLLVCMFFFMFIRISCILHSRSLRYMKFLKDFVF